MTPELTWHARVELLRRDMSQYDCFGACNVRHREGSLDEIADCGGYENMALASLVHRMLHIYCSVGWFALEEGEYTRRCDEEGRDAERTDFMYRWDETSPYLLSRVPWDLTVRRTWREFYAYMDEMAAVAKSVAYEHALVFGGDDYRVNIDRMFFDMAVREYEDRVAYGRGVEIVDLTMCDDGVVIDLTEDD